MKRLIGVFCTTFLALGCQTGPTPSLPTTPTTVSNPAPGPRPNPTPSPIAGTRIASGQSIADRVGSDAPHCFEQWDATARCRQFDIALSSSGALTARLMWIPVAGQWDPDLFFVYPNGDWRVAGDSLAPKSATISVEAGPTYRIVVLSYRIAGEEFTLSTELQ